MLLVFTLTALSITCTASSVHKYPFVFLLDVGNEELGKDNTEQIKVSVPGGALAIKYPANGEGDVIGHVRVTGIDYGTDLKSNIVEGGPGYRYVVLVFKGNLGVQYDATVTIQTLDGKNFDTKEDTRQSMSVESGRYEVNEETDDPNNSAEETDNEPETKSVYSEKMNAEIMQSSSNMYRYVQNENMRVDNEDNTLEESDVSEIINNLDNNINVDNLVRNNVGFNVDSDSTYDADIPRNSLSDYSKNRIIEKEIDSQEDTESDDSEVNDEVDNLQNDDPITVSNFDVSYDSVIPIKLLSGYGRFDAFKPHFYGDVMVYPQVAMPQDRVLIDHSEDDDRQNNSEGQTKDSNNNDNDYVLPVEY